MKSAPLSAPVPPSGVATPTPARLHSSVACGHCRREIPNPRPGQKACSSRCRWALWKAGRQTEAQRQVEGRRERDERVRELLTAALAALNENA